MDKLTGFALADLERILRDIRSSIQDKDWVRLEAKAEDLKVWARWQQKEARTGVSLTNTNFDK